MNYYVITYVTILLFLGTKSATKMKTGAIVGIVFAVLVSLTIIGIAIFFVQKLANLLKNAYRK